MERLPTCPVCGHEVEPDGEHTEVSVTMNPRRGEEEAYYLHRRCASGVFGGWEA